MRCVGDDGNGVDCLVFRTARRWSIFYFERRARDETPTCGGVALLFA
jgi:hypothetical protein